MKSHVTELVRDDALWRNACFLRLRPAEYFHHGAFRVSKLTMSSMVGSGSFGARGMQAVRGRLFLEGIEIVVRPSWNPSRVQRGCEPARRMTE